MKLLPAIAFALAVAPALSACGKRPSESCNGRIVAEVGACGRNGWCAVRLKDGAYGHSQLPMAGAPAAYCSVIPTVNGP